MLLYLIFTMYEKYLLYLFRVLATDKMQQILGTNVPPEYLPPRAGDVRDSLADISAAKELIGYEPSVLFNEGLEKTVKAYAGR